MAETTSLAVTAIFDDTVHKSISMTPSQLSVAFFIQMRSNPHWLAALSIGSGMDSFMEKLAEWW